MDTPGARQPRASGLLYGADCHSINRRSLLAGAAALASVPVGARRPLGPVARAMAAAGGSALLSRVRAVAWSGTARAVLGTVPVDLTYETRIEPFVRGRSNTWVTSDGRSTMRTIMVERDTAFLVHDGAQTALPAAQGRFERQQFGAYAYLLLARAFVSTAGPARLNAAHDGYPPIALALASDGRIASADYVLASPRTDGASIRQHLSFAGTIAASGVRFPRSVTIMQGGRLQLRMTVADFAVELAA